MTFDLLFKDIFAFLLLVVYNGTPHKVIYPPSFCYSLRSWHSPLKEIKNVKTLKISSKDKKQMRCPCHQDYFLLVLSAYSISA